MDSKKIVLKDFEIRMLYEYAELKYRVDKLNDFIVTDKFLTLNDRDAELLNMQYNAMYSYLNILDKRLDSLFNVMPYNVILKNMDKIKEIQKKHDENIITFIEERGLI